MDKPFVRIGKQVLTNGGTHYADAADDTAAQFMLDALNAKATGVTADLLDTLKELRLYADGLEGIIRNGVYRSEALEDPNAWAAADDWDYNGEGAAMRDQVAAAIAKATGAAE